MLSIRVKGWDTDISTAGHSTEWRHAATRVVNLITIDGQDGGRSDWYHGQRPGVSGLYPPLDGRREPGQFGVVDDLDRASALELDEAAAFELGRRPAGGLAREREEVRDV